MMDDWASNVEKTTRNIEQTNRNVDMLVGAINTLLQIDDEMTKYDCGSRIFNSTN